MAMSLPGQISARYIEVPQITGTVTQLTDDSFVLVDEKEQTYSVALHENIFYSQLLPLEEEEINEDLLDMEESAKEEEDTQEDEDLEEDTHKVETQEGEDEEVLTQEGFSSALPVELEEGDLVTVFYRGDVPTQEEDGFTLDAIEIRLILIED